MAHDSGATGTLLMRGDSAFYSAEVVAACRDHCTRFSITARLDPKAKAAIVAIPDNAGHR